jgi:hypothetical protein
MTTLRALSVSVFAAMLWAPSAGAQRLPAAPEPPAVVPAPAPQQTPPAPTPPGGLCCCRTWARGWQYSWLAAPQCTAQNGTCVSPDHCGS